VEMKPGADHFKLVRDAWLLTKPKQDIYPPTEPPNWYQCRRGGYHAPQTWPSLVELVGDDVQWPVKQ
ncbi:hypothetical protein QR685DRAFT_442733, partial [Neurospora intermedia]